MNSLNATVPSLNDEKCVGEGVWGSQAAFGISELTLEEPETMFNQIAFHRFMV